MHETQNKKHETERSKFIELREMFILEWSERQGWFHVGNVEEMIGKNIRSYIDGSRSDYALVGIADTQEDAETLMHLLRNERKAPLPEQLPDEVMLADSAFQIVSPTAPPPPAGQYKLKPLASAVRRDHFKPMPLGDGREIIPYKRR